MWCALRITIYELEEYCLFISSYLFHYNRLSPWRVLSFFFTSFVFFFAHFSKKKPTYIFKFPLCNFKLSLRGSKDVRKLQHKIHAGYETFEKGLPRVGHGGIHKEPESICEGGPLNWKGAETWGECTVLQVRRLWWKFVHEGWGVQQCPAPPDASNHQQNWWQQGKKPNLKVETTVYIHHCVVFFRKRRVFSEDSSWWPGVWHHPKVVGK